MTLAGFSGLVAAFRRGGVWKPMDGYRLRQIPEMALAATLAALIAGPVTDAVGSATAAVRIIGAAGLAFTAAHVVVLVLRARRSQIRIPRQGFIGAGLIDLAIFGTAGICIGTGGAVAYEWLLVVLLVRPIVAFVLVLGDVAAN
jgi:hypothetical protein